MPKLSKSNFSSIGFQEVVEERARENDIEFLTRTITTMCVKIDYVENVAIEQHTQLEEQTKSCLDLESRLQKQIDLHAMDVKDLRDKLNKETAKLKTVEAEHQKLKDATDPQFIKLKQGELQDVIIHQTAEIDELKERIKAQDQQIYSDKANSDAQVVKIQALTQDLQMLKLNTKSRANEEDALKAGTRALQDKVDQLKLQNEEYETELDDLTGQLKRLPELSQKLKASEKLVQELQQQLENANQIAEKQEKEINTNKVDFEESQARCSGLEMQIMSQKLRASSLAVPHEQFQSEEEAKLIYELQNTQVLNISKIAKLEAENRQLTTEQDKLFSSIDLLKKQLEEQKQNSQPGSSLDSAFNLSGGKSSIMRMDTQQKVAMLVPQLKQIVKSYKSDFASLKVNIPTFQIVAAVENLMNKYQKDSAEATAKEQNMALMLNDQMAKNRTIMERADEQKSKDEALLDKQDAVIKKLQGELRQIYQGPSDLKSSSMHGIQNTRINEKSMEQSVERSITDPERPKASKSKFSLDGAIGAFGSLFGGAPPKIKTENSKTDFTDYLVVSEADPILDIGKIYIGENSNNKEYKFKFTFTNMDQVPFYSSFSANNDKYPCIDLKFQFEGYAFGIITLTIKDSIKLNYFVKEVPLQVQLNYKTRNQLTSQQFCVLEVKYQLVPTIIGLPVDQYRDISLQDLKMVEVDGWPFITMNESVILKPNHVDTMPTLFRMLKGRIQSKIYGDELNADNLFNKTCFESMLLTELIQYTPQPSALLYLKSVVKPEQISQVMEQLPSGPIKFLCELVVSLRLATSIDKDYNYKQTSLLLFQDASYEKFLRCLFSYQ